MRRLEPPTCTVPSGLVNDCATATYRSFKPAQKQVIKYIHLLYFHQKRENLEPYLASRDTKSFEKLMTECLRLLRNLATILGEFLQLHFTVKHVSQTQLR